VNKANTEAAESKMQKNDSSGLKLGFLLITGFLLPFLLIFLTSHDNDIPNRVYHAVRLGGLGFLLALVILWLGYMDQKIRQASNTDKKSQLVATFLGMMLWLVWLGTGQIVFIAADETKAADAVFR
jgi:hypothetical protein